MYRMSHQFMELGWLSLNRCSIILPSHPYHTLVQATLTTRDLSQPEPVLKHIEHPATMITGRHLIHRYWCYKHNVIPTRAQPWENCQ